MDSREYSESFDLSLLMREDGTIQPLDIGTVRCMLGRAWLDGRLYQIGEDCKKIRDGGIITTVAIDKRRN